MDPVYETKKRLDMVKQISKPLEGIVEGVMLGGSVAYGRNYSVTDKSDIDLVIVIKKNQLSKLIQSSYFKDNVSYTVQNLFIKKEIDVFWTTRIIDNVEVNAFVYDITSYKNFCLLNRSIKSYMVTAPYPTQKAYDFEGKLIESPRTVQRLSNGFIYNKYSLVNGKFVMFPPTYDYLYSGKIIYQQNNFLTEMEKKVWEKLAKQLVLEHGRDVDLDKYTILNTHFIYMKSPERVPQSIVDKIVARTKKELKKISKKEIKK